MTYPEWRYRGDGGEPSAIFRPADHSPYLATGASAALARSGRPSEEEMGEFDRFHDNVWL